MPDRTHRLQLIRSLPLLAGATAVGLLLAGLLLLANNEQTFRTQTVREDLVQARIVAASLSAALAFNDEAAMREYIDALRANPQVRAAGVYDTGGRRLAGYVRRRGEPLPARAALTGPAFRGGQLTVTAPVVQGTTRLGLVYLRADAEPLTRRATRYGVIALLLVLTSLVLGVLGMAQRALARANLDLRRANRQLRIEMSEREKAEAALRQSQKMEAMGQLTGGVAHDFNNLLMIASGGLEMMDRTADPARRERLKDGVRQALDRGAGLTRQLLAFSRKAPLKAEVTDLAARVEGMRVLLERSIREDIEVRIDMPPGLWPVEVDVTQLEVVLLNLAVNSKDAMPDGGVITISARNEPGGEGLPEDHVRLSVSDTGVGMTPEVISRVFEPFFTTKGVGQGTGLGLSQVYGFARGSGGDVRVESQVGEGSTVTLLLPRSQKPPPPKPARVRRRDAQKSAGSASILLVEDDDGVAATVAGMLEELGYRVKRAITAAQALEMLGEGGVDLVFSDMVMPGPMDGIGLAHELAKRSPQTPIVLTTGFSEAAAAAAREGLRLLLKPYDIDSLASELEAALAGNRSGAQSR